MGGMPPTLREKRADTTPFFGALRRAIELGVNFFDTAGCYGAGKGERLLGEAVREAREVVHISTKVGPCCYNVSPSDFTGDVICKKFPETLARLGVEYVDLVLLHDIQHLGEGSACVSSILKHGGPMEALFELKKEGMVGFIGASGRIEELIHLMRTGTVDAVLTYNRLNPLSWDAERELLPLAVELDIGVIVGGPFYQGLLAGEAERVLREKPFWPWDAAFHSTDAVLKKLKKIYSLVGNDNRRLRDMTLRFVLSHLEVSTTIPGAKNATEVEENVAVSDGRLLTAQEMRMLKEI